MVEGTATTPCRSEGAELLAAGEGLHANPGGRHTAVLTGEGGIVKLWYLLREAFYLVRRRKSYLLAPLLLLLVLVALVAFYVGPGAVVTFMYAGV